MAWIKEWKKYLKDYQCPVKTKSVKLTQINEPPKSEYRVYCDKKYVGNFYTGSEIEGIGIFSSKKGYKKP